MGRLVIANDKAKNAKITAQCKNNISMQKGISERTNPELVLEAKVYQIKWSVSVYQLP